MRTLGVMLTVVGILSSALYFFHMNFYFLSWIDDWGQNTAWAIRAAFLVTGIVLWLTGKPRMERA